MSINYEIYKQIKNKTRKELLLFIYQEPRTYTQLVELTQLKPGSLYHHLKILDTLIAKVDHGLYAITPEGRKVIEELQLLPVSATKPAVQAQPINSSAKSTAVADQSETDNQHQTLDDRLADIWLGWNSYILSGVVLLIMVLLAIFGISLAGSAVYAAGSFAFLVDVLSIFIGVVLLYYVESFLQTHKVYNKIKFLVTIRLFTMIPGAIVGFALLLLYMLGITVAAPIFPWLFSVTLLAGLIVSASGISYLRAQPFSESLFTAGIPILADLLFGVTILLSTY